jgi:hypothetical protein
MSEAQYFRSQAALCIEIANQISDSTQAENLRTEAANYLARAKQIEETQITPTTSISKPR